MFSECPERKNDSNNKVGKGNVVARVFAMQHEEAPTVDILARTFIVASHPAYVLIDTGATHSCISEKFLSSCKLHAEVRPNSVMCINTPLGSGSMITRVVRSLDIVIKDIHMPVDALILPTSDFEMVLGMN